jgi:exoribonuclease R
MCSDYTSRARERHVMNSLIEYNIGGGYCHAWYSRRFLSPVQVVENCAPHSGLGLQCYVQWTSPIRRYSDLLVHIIVKRYLRRNRIHELIEEGASDIEALGLLAEDIGCCLPRRTGPSVYEWDISSLDEDINFSEGAGLMGAARMLQRQSNQYWLYEYIQRIHRNDPDTTFEAVVLGYAPGIDSSKKQYAIYIYELGFEYRYTSPINLAPGVKLKLRVSTISPRTGVLTFVRTNA